MAKGVRPLTAVDDERFSLGEVPSIADESWLHGANGNHAAEESEAERTDAWGDPVSPVVVETWREFASKSTAEVPCIVDGLWPEGAIGFIASPPKKGQTWLALSLAISVATGTQYLARFPVPTARPVLYLALEGHRAALTHRVGALMRGAGLNPDEELPNLHLSYKPRGINIADPGWAQHITDACAEINAQLVIVDVLRAAAVIKENSPEEFARMIANLSPLLDGVRSLALLHHFTKLSETSKERTPGERMSGSGAMYGALDIGVYITGSDNHARKLRVDFEARDIASPDGQGFELAGTGTGQNGGFNYGDKAWWTPTEAPDEDDVSAPAEEVIEWLIQQGGEADEQEAAFAFDVSVKTISRRRSRLHEMGVDIVTKPGKRTRYRISKRYTTHQTEVGHDPGQDTLDTCPTPPVSNLKPSNNAGLPRTLDTLDTEDVSNPGNATFAGKTEVGQVGLPYGREDVVSDVPPVEEETAQHDPDDDLPF
jgi:hypothetical protein